MLAAILNRPQKDTIGFALITEEISFTPSLDTLLALALQVRPMVIHDSLMIDESRSMLSLARQEYLPDFTVGIGYMGIPRQRLRTWGAFAGISIPFAPWTLSKASGRVQEARAQVLRSEAAYNATRNMVIANVSELYHSTIADKNRLDTYRTRILPSAHQSLEASVIGYQTGAADFLMLLDAFRTFVELRMDYYMIRLNFEQSVAELERAVGFQGVANF
jgi:outer membrane protein TolC